MYWSLRDETVGEWDRDDAANKRCASKEKEVPVETSWLFERKLFGLGGEGTDVVIVVEEESHQDANGESDEYPFHR